MNDAHLADDLKLIEPLSKLFAVALGLLYLFGFLVVTSYLSRFGVSSFPVLQLQYLIAGFWFLGPPVIYASILGTARRFDERAAPETKGKFNWRRFAISLTFSGIPAGVFIGLLSLIPDIESLTWGIVMRLVLFYIAIVNCAHLFWMSRRASTETESWWMNRSHAAPFYLMLLLTIVMGYAVWFSARIYPLIPFSLGGGRPLTVEFFGGERKMPDEIQRSATSENRSIPYKLLLSTDKSYVVVSPSSKERSLEISRDTVAGMIIVE